MKRVLLVFIISILFFTSFVIAFENRSINLNGFTINSPDLTGDATKGFDLNSLLIKVNVKEGDSVTKVLSINRGSGQQIFLNSVNLQGISLSENSFVLEQDKTKNIEVKFDSSGLKPGIYVGSIKISDEKETFYLPVIFEIETQDLFYDANLDIPPQYSQIVPGDKLVAQMKFFDLTSGGTQTGLGANNIKVEYYVYGIDGSVISSESEGLIVDKQTQVTKTVVFPQNVKEGNYVFAVVIRYGSSVGVASYMFSVVTSKAGSSLFDSSGVDIKFISILAVIVLLFFGAMFFFIYLVKDRDKLILELRGYNTGELKRQKQILAEQARVLVKKKEVHPVVIKQQIEKKIKELKVKQEKRVEHIKHLKKSGNVEGMKKMITAWKKEGYNTLPMEYKLKGLSSGEMKSILNKWKGRYSANEGYKNSR